MCMAALNCHHVMLASQIRVTPLTTKRIDHQGIKVQLLGQIELASERGQPHEFVSLGELKRFKCIWMLKR